MYSRRADALSVKIDRRALIRDLAAITASVALPSARAASMPAMLIM
jgi:hypothetical protein